MEYKLIELTETHLTYTDDKGVYRQACARDLVWKDIIPRFNTADSHQILKLSRNKRGEYTLDRSGRLLWTPRALRPIRIALMICFAACMTLSVLCESRIVFVEWFGHSTPLFGSILFFPFAFALSDIMNELFGYRVTQHMIITTAVLLIFTGLTFEWTLSLPDFFHNQKEAEYLAIFSIFPNAFIIHGVSLFFGDLANARLFAYLRGLLVNRYLWFRSFVSTFTAQVFYSLVCSMMVYLYNYHPEQTRISLFEIILYDHFFKMGIALAGLPLIYLVIQGVYLWNYKKNIAHQHRSLPLEA